MAHLHIPLTGHDILLSPRWGDDSPNWLLALLAPVVLVPIALIVWLYTYELRLINRLAATALLGLRLVVVALLLLLVGLQPALLPVRPEPARQRVLVLIDRTESMDVTDPQRTTAEKLRLARALRLHQGVCSDLQIDGLVAAAESPTDEDNVVDRPAREELCAKVDALSRTQIGQLLLSPQGGDLLKKLSARFDVELVGFAGATVDAGPERLQDILVWPDGYDLVLLSALDDQKKIPTEGTRRIIVAAVNQVLHFRIFDLEGKRVVDADETTLKGQATQIAELRNQLQTLWSPHDLTRSEKGSVISAVTAIVRPLWSNSNAARPATVVPRNFTDLGLPLNRALELASRDRSTVRGVILLSDGRHNRPLPPEDALALAGRLGEQRIPLYPVVLGARQARPGISIPSLEAPTILVQDGDGSDKTIKNATISAVVRVQSVPAGPLEVDLLGGSKGVLGTVTVDHEPRPGELDRPVDYPVTFNVALNDLGPQNLTVAVRPIHGVAEKDLRSRDTAVAVVNDQAEVLLIDGEARWEYHYVAVALGRDPQIRKVASVVYDQPRLDRIPEAELKKANWMERQLPPAPFALNDYDIIVLGDVTSEQMPVKERPVDLKPELPADDWDRLARFVKEKGGTLVVVGGKRSMPLGLLATGTPDKPHPLAELLPIEAPRIVKSRGGFPVALTEEGRQNTLLQLTDPTDDKVAADDVWSKLPPHYWAVVGRKKPAATTLAYARQDDDPDNLTKKQQEERSLIAWHSVGKGRVLFVGLDSTWRWRYNIGDQHHHRFWGQLSRWAMGDKLVTGGAGAIRYGTTRTAFEPGQAVDVRLRLVGDQPALPEKTGAEVRLVRIVDGKDDEISRLTLQPNPGQPHAFDGTARDLAPGTYRIDLDIPDGSPLKEAYDKAVGPDNKRPASPLFVVAPSDSAEQRDVTPDLALLRELAQRSRPGMDAAAVKVHTADDASAIVDELTREEETAEVVRPLPLWESWWVLGIFVVLMTMEWVGRKMAGLP